MNYSDKVTFYCPICGEKLEEETKAGNCELKNYHHSSVPAHIAKALITCQVFCPVCNDYYKIAGEIPRVSLFLVKSNEANGYD